MLKKLLRTLQSQLPFAKDAKDDLYFWSRRLLRRPHESQFRAISLLPDGCYVDVGANQGQSIESIRLFKPNTEIIAFEPNPSLAASLTARYRSYPNIQVHGFGLADVDSEFQLYVPSYNGFVYDAMASFDHNHAARSLSSHSIYWFRPDKLLINQYACHTRRLDDLHLDPVFIKIDVEGYEFQVLQGSKETLLRCSPVIMVEDPSRESRQLLADYGYQEQVFDGRQFRPGATTTEGPNAFFTRARDLREPLSANTSAGRRTRLADRAANCLTLTRARDIPISCSSGTDGGIPTVFLCWQRYLVFGLTQG